MNEEYSKALDGLMAGLDQALWQIEMRGYFADKLRESVKPKPLTPTDVIKPDLYRKLLGGDDA